MNPIQRRSFSPPSASGFRPSRMRPTKWTRPWPEVCDSIGSALPQRVVTGGRRECALADAAGLSRGAMTTALDRIEAAGFARRVWDQHDRRTVRVEMTDAAKQEVEVLYSPLAKEGFQLLQKYTTQQLEAVLRYLEDGRQLQRAHAQRIRGLSDAAAAAARLVRGRRATRSTKAHSRNTTSR